MRQQYSYIQSKEDINSQLNLCSLLDRMIKWPHIANAIF